MKKPKVHSEQETRQSMRATAAELGCLKELDDILVLTDKRLLGCVDPVAREQIAIEGIKMIEMLLTTTPQDIEINGKLVKLK